MYLSLSNRHSPYLFKHFNVQSLQISVNGESFPTPAYRPVWTGSAVDYSRLYLALLENSMKEDRGIAITPEMFLDKG